MQKKPILHTERKIKDVLMTGQELVEKFGFENEFFAPTNRYFVGKNLLNINTYKNSIKHRFAADYGQISKTPENYQYADNFDNVIKDTQKTILDVVQNLKNNLSQRKISDIFTSKEAKEENLKNLVFLDNLIEELVTSGADFFNIEYSESCSYLIPKFEYEEKETIYEVSMNNMIDVRNGKPLFKIRECELCSIQLKYYSPNFHYAILYKYKDSDYIAQSFDIQKINGVNRMISSSEYTEIFDNREDAEAFVYNQINNLMVA